MSIILYILYLKCLRSNKMFSSSAFRVPSVLYVHSLHDSGYIRRQHISIVLNVIYALSFAQPLCVYRGRGGG